MLSSTLSHIKPSFQQILYNFKPFAKIKINFNFSVLNFCWAVYFSTQVYLCSKRSVVLSTCCWIDLTSAWAISIFESLANKALSLSYWDIDRKLSKYLCCIASFYLDYSHHSHCLYTPPALDHWTRQTDY